MMIDDIEIEAKFESGLNQLIQELDRLKLPPLVESVVLGKIAFRSGERYQWDCVKQSQRA